MSDQIEAVATAFAAVTTDDASAPAPAAANIFSSEFKPSRFAVARAS
ncbi:hypothetical protein MY8738_001100 [Beauveria namnaoensis]